MNKYKQNMTNPNANDKNILSNHPYPVNYDHPKEYRQNRIMSKI